MPAVAEFAYNRSVGRPKIKGEARSYRLAQDVTNLLDEMIRQVGGDRTFHIEAAVREKAERMGITAASDTRSVTAASAPSDTRPPDARNTEPYQAGPSGASILREE